MNSKDQRFQQWKEKITEIRQKKAENPGFQTQKERILTDLLVFSSAIHLMNVCRQVKKSMNVSNRNVAGKVADCVAALAGGGEFLLKAGLGFGAVALLAEAIDAVCTTREEKAAEEEIEEKPVIEQEVQPAPVEEEPEPICPISAQDPVAETAEEDDSSMMEVSADQVIANQEPQEAPAEEAAPAEEEVVEAPAEEAAPAEEEVVEAPAEEAAPAEEEVVEAPAEEAAPVVEEVVEAPAEEAAPAEEEVVEAPAEEAAPVVEEAVEAVAMVEKETENEDSDGDETSEDFLAGLGDYQLNFIDAEENPEAYAELLRQEEAGEVKLVVRYRKGFSARLIQAQGSVPEYYSAMKNALLDYKGVKGRVSWTFDSYHCGRDRIAKINVKNKTIYLYLALDPKEMEDTKYGTVDMSGKKKFEEEPVLLKIKGERKFKYALELIDKVCAEKLQLTKMNQQSVDYTVPYQDTESLVKVGAVKKLVAAVPTSLVQNQENKEA